MILELDVINTWTLITTQIFLGGYVLLLIDFRSPKKQWRRIWLTLVVLVVSANAAAILFCGFWDTYAWARSLTVTLPYVLLTLWCSEYRGFRTIFGISTALFIGCAGAVNDLFAQQLFPSAAILPIIVRLISFLVFFLILRKFTRTYRRMLFTLDRGWGVLSILPIFTFLIMLYILNTLYPSNPLPMLAVLYSLVLICGCAYWLMYYFFDRMELADEARKREKFLRLQVEALHSRMEAVQALEEAIRIERHDLRHRLQAAAQLLKKGEPEKAVSFIADAQLRLKQSAPRHWCSSPILDAVFSSCFRQAQYKKILVDARISLPEQLPADEGDLAAVFANALENAILVCGKLPPDKRAFRFQTIASPQFMFEIAIPEPPNFDGIGRLDAPSPSTLAFCRKYHALYKYEAADGWITFQVIL